MDTKNVTKYTNLSTLNEFFLSLTLNFSLFVHVLHYIYVTPVVSNIKDKFLPA